jgi:UDP-glucose-4-epimerase GalE
LKKETVLVTGGAGYIGSQNCKYLYNNNFIPITYDNLSEGNKYAVKWGPLIEGDINDFDKLNDTIKKYKPKAVMHFAANALVSESVLNPRKYYENNVCGTLNLLSAMLDNDVKYIIFSSSCAAYGKPIFSPITEEHPRNPMSAYGKSKYMIEQILEDYNKAYGLNYISLRYFNASGADLETQIGEDRKLETHLIPLAIDTALGINPFLNVYGTDFNTKDGTAIRDYIHIEDIASAHIKSFYHILKNQRSLTLNLGSEVGYSVLEVIKEIEKHTQKKLNIILSKRRLGDPPVLFANASLAKKVLRWEPKFSDLKTIIMTAIKWHKKKKNF